MAAFSPRLWLVLAVISGCSSEPRRADPPTHVAQSPLLRTGIEGCNCAGAAPAMTAPDGVAYPFQSIVAYYYQVLEAFWTKVDGNDVLKTWLAPSIEATGEELYAWQAKSVQIYRDRDLLGFAHRYYRGTFGFLAGEGGEQTCTPALDEPTRTTGMLAHVGLSQAGVCGENDDGTTKFWQVNRIVLLMIGDVVDAFALVDAGLAQVVELAPIERCILPAVAAPGPIAQPIAGELGAVIPCRIAFRDDAVTEAVVLPVPSAAVVADVALGHRPFTAAGTVVMPNALDEVRTILRDGQLRVMYAIGLPRFAPEPAAGPTQVRLVGHTIGPARQVNPLLLPEERSWVDATVGAYDDRCCHVECDAPDSATAEADRPGARRAMAGHSVVRRDAGASDAMLEDADVPGDAMLDDAGAPGDAPFDPPPADAVIAFPDAGTFPPFPDAGTFPPFPDAGTFPPFPDAGFPPFPDAALPPGPVPVDAGVPVPPDAPPPPHDAGVPGCRTVCVAEGACATSSAATGLVVLVSAQTTKECNGSCPEPASGAPATEPTCAP